MSNFFGKFFFILKKKNWKIDLEYKILEDKLFVKKLKGYYLNYLLYILLEEKIKNS